MASTNDEPIASVGVPKKFVKAKGSFLKNLSDSSSNKALSSFCAFPMGFRFSGINPEEEVILVVRQHLAVFIPQYLLIAFLVLSPILFSVVLGAVNPGDAANVVLSVGAAFLFVLLALTVAADTFFKWYFTVNIITDQRIVDVDFNNVLFHKFADAQIEKIEDISHKVTGIFGSLFDYGSVYMQTAGAYPKFEFKNIPKPRVVQDILDDVLEMKQNGQI